MKEAILILSLLLIATSCLAESIAINNDDLAAESTWKSLGGDFMRTGLSGKNGPEIGCVKWQFTTDGPISASVTIGSGGRIHIPCEDGKLYTLDPNGSLLWSYDANSPLLSSPTIGPDGTVYVGSKNGKLYAIDINGNLRWTHTTDGPICSSPAVSKEGNVYAGSQDGKLYALGQDGSKLWSFKTKGPGKVSSGSIIASPAIGGDGTIYIAGLYDPNLYALDPNNGSLKWTCHFKSGGWPFASPVVAKDGTIYQTLLYDPNLYAIEPNKGTIAWSTNLADPCTASDKVDADGWSEPVLGPDGTIYVSLNDPYLRAVKPDGNIKWVTRLGMMGGFTLTIGSDGLIYAAGDDSHLYVVDANGWEIARFETKNWLSFPVISADNTIIVGDTQDYSLLITDTINMVWAITRDCYEGHTLDLHWPEDLDGSRTVDFADFVLLADTWLGCTDRNWPCEYEGEELYLTSDINRNLYIDFTDIESIAEQWLREVRVPKPIGLRPGWPEPPKPPVAEQQPSRVRR